jgi:hypothetical protein
MKPLPLATALSCLLCAAVPATSTAAQTLKLDLKNPVNELADGVAAQSAALGAGERFVVRVSGTATFWSPTDALGAATCGTPDAQAIGEPSPGSLPTIATVDPAVVFASPIGAFLDGEGACQGEAPKAPPYPTALMFGTNGSFAAAIPVGGVPKTPRADHTYLYEVTGTGAPLQFRVHDVRADDNNGVFTIDVMTRAECDAQGCLGAPTPAPVATPRPTPTPTLAPTPTPKPTPSPTPACVSGRTLSFTVAIAKGATVRRASFAVNGRFSGSRSGGQLFDAKGAARVQTIKKVPASGDVTVTVVARMRDRTLSRGTKLFKRCSSKPSTVVSSISLSEW